MVNHGITWRYRFRAILHIRNGALQLRNSAMSGWIQTIQVMKIFNNHFLLRVLFVQLYEETKGSLNNRFYDGVILGVNSSSLSSKTLF